MSRNTQARHLLFGLLVEFRQSKRAKKRERAWVTSLQISSRPRDAPICNGVAPLRSFWAFTSAPASISTVAASQDCNMPNTGKPPRWTQVGDKTV